MFRHAHPCDLNPGRYGGRLQAVLAVSLCLLLASPALAKDEATDASSGAPRKAYASDKNIGIEEKLGQTISLDLSFTDEDGKSVVLRDLVKRPTILILVYYRCPTICSPLLREVGRNVDKADIVPGVDYDLLTVSFDVTDTPKLARDSKAELLRALKTKVPPDSWHFLTGDAENITRLTDAVGFRFKQDQQDFAHAATLVFLSPEGKIVRYLGGLRLLPADLKLAVIDAAEGRPRTLMQRLQRLCYAYDPEGKTYVLQVNRIILVVTLTILGVFLAFLLLKRKKAPGPTPTTTTEART